MRILLKNFRCYTNSIFDFGEKGLVLLSGSSGKGKTSIILGIYFALYGTGTKLIMNGKKSCLVELEINGLKIVRSKGPNRLIVNNMYEDDAGQEVIDKKFGNNFGLSDYIKQNYLNNFILMSPSEKLMFLEKFAFSGIDLLQIKTKCKSYIQKYTQELSDTLLTLEVTEEIFKKMSKPTLVKFPLNCKKTKRQLAIKNEAIKLKNRNTLLKKNIKLRNRLKEELNDLEIFNITIETNKHNIEKIDIKISKIQEKINNCIYEGDEKLENYKNYIKYIISENQYRISEEEIKIEKENLKIMKNEEILQFKNEIKNIKDNLWKEYSKNEIDDIIHDFKLSIDDVEKINSLKYKINMYKNVSKNSIENYIKELKITNINLENKQEIQKALKIQKETYQCPSCFKNLKLVKNKLRIVELYKNININLDLSKINTEINEIKNKITKLENLIFEQKNNLKYKEENEKKLQNILSEYNCEELSTIKEMTNDLENLENYKQSQLELENKIKKLECDIRDEKLSYSYDCFKTNYIVLENNLKALKKVIEVDKNQYKDISNFSLEELQTFVLEQIEHKKNIKKLQTLYEELQDEKETYVNFNSNKTKEYKKKYPEIREKNVLQNLITHHTKEIKNLINEKNKHTLNIKNIDEWKKYQINLEKYESLNNKILNIKKEEKEKRSKLTASKVFRDKILEAESICITNIVNSINIHAQLYIDYFFTENQMNVKLKTFKETKKIIKPLINLEITYKNMEVNFNLSDGELARVILAFNLAFNEMFNTPLILLDECTSKLDQELTNTVFHSLKEQFTNKLIVVVAHQVVTGIFDKTINL